ncbi:MAG: terminase, partial [Acidobacteria bacterium Pan2503]|nr:terminase [Candidatus Acidoferrum panamensis]
MPGSPEFDLADWLASVSADPLAYVMGAFPWSEPNTRLENYAGPEPWQHNLLNQIRDGLPIDKAIQLATASGHGVGKSALVSWIIKWAADTKPDTRGVVTANTETQLKTKTWSELGKWHHMSITRDVFKLTATAYFHPDHERTWRIDMVPWSERNTEAFAGLHNQGRRILVIFDEASAIPDVIWETTEGALTDADTQILWAVFGNPTRNTGRFRECFAGGRFARAWLSRQVDSRAISFTDKTQIDRWIEVYGADSDFVRVRVLGTFPRTGEMEFISHATVSEAILREVDSYRHDPLVLGVDVARYGDNESVIYARKGRDAQTIPPIRLRGLDVVALSSRVAEEFHRLRASAIFVDGGGVGGGVVDTLRNLHVPCFDVQFGAKPSGSGFAIGETGTRYANKRAEMWGAMREWLKIGAIPNNADLRTQLVGPLYVFNIRNEIQLERKEDMRRRGLESPDIADALALTFAFPVSAHADAGGEGLHRPIVESEYNPYDPERM